MDLSEEKELVERARREPDAFGKLYDQYYSQIFGYVLKRVANVEVAEDITSEVFFKALKNIGQFRWQNISFWLYRIATNQITDHFRKSKHEIASLEETTEPISLLDPSVKLLEAAEELIRQQDFLLLHESISKLPIKYQEVITLRFFEKKQFKEIAQILGMQEGAVKALLRRSLEKLRKIMEKA
jgi:RNA polymerase sigma-70 factor (ECF subfamily)